MQKTKLQRCSLPINFSARFLASSLGVAFILRICIFSVSLLWGMKFFFILSHHQRDLIDMFING